MQFLSVICFCTEAVSVSMYLGIERFKRRALVCLERLKREGKGISLELVERQQGRKKGSQK